MKRLTPLIAAVLCVACSKDIQNADAVKQSVIDYLRGRTAQTGLDMNLMQVDVTAVSFEKNEARATVYFRPKNSPEGGGMAMNYVLDRKGNKWEVKGRQDNSSNPHGGGQTLAPAELPPGHPPTGAGAGASDEMPPLPPLPQGHPSVGSKQ